MKEQEITEQIARGAAIFTTRMDKFEDHQWQPHPTFPGVRLKTLIAATDTQGLFSSHLVSIAPGSSLETHCHPEQLELHEVIAGAGQLTMNVTDTSYECGKMAVIPQGCQHRVEAGSDGLTLLAKFFPGN